MSSQTRPEDQGPCFTCFGNGIPVPYLTLPYLRCLAWRPSICSCHHNTRSSIVDYLEIADRTKYSDTHLRSDNLHQRLGKEVVHHTNPSSSASPHHQPANNQKEQLFWTVSRVQLQWPIKSSTRFAISRRARSYVGGNLPPLWLP